MRKHASLNSSNLSLMVEAARDIRDKEEEDKKRDIEAGRRNEVDDLPTGHPLKVMMEDAQKRFESQKQQTEERQTTMKTAKKMEPNKKNTANQPDEAHRSRVVMANKYNNAVQEVLGRLEGLRNLAADAAKTFHGFQEPHVKLNRVSRAIAAVCFALNESKISANERG